MDCPICHGSGVLPTELNTLPIKQRRQLTLALHAAGYCIPDIMRLAGWDERGRVVSVLRYANGGKSND